MEYANKQHNPGNKKQDKLNSTFLKIREFLPATMQKLVSKDNAEFEVALQNLKSKLEKQPAGILSLHELTEICGILESRFWGKETSEEMRFKITDVLILLPYVIISDWKNKVHSGVPIISDEIRKHIYQKLDEPPKQKKDYKRVVIVGRKDEVFAECDKVNLEHIFAKRGLFDTRIYSSNTIGGVIAEVIDSGKKIICCILGQTIKYSIVPFIYFPSSGIKEIKYFEVENFGGVRNWKHILSSLEAKKINCKVFLLQVLPDKKLEEVVKEFSLDIEIIKPIDFLLNGENILDKKGIFENC